MIAPFPNIMEKRKIKKESRSKAVSRQIAYGKSLLIQTKKKIKN